MTVFLIAIALFSGRSLSADLTRPSKLPERYDQMVHLLDVGLYRLESAQVLSTSKSENRGMATSKVRIELDLNVEGNICEADPSNIFVYIENESRSDARNMRLFLKTMSKNCFFTSDKRNLKVVYDIELPQHPMLQSVGYKLGVGDSTLYLEADKDWTWKAKVFDRPLGTVPPSENRGYTNGGFGTKGAQIALGGKGEVYSPSIDPALIGKKIREHLREIRNCFERELQRSPETFGLVVIKWELRNDGRAYKAALSSFEHDALKPSGECIARRLSTWKFPQGIKASIQFPIRYIGKDGIK